MIPAINAIISIKYFRRWHSASMINWSYNWGSTAAQEMTTKSFLEYYHFLKIDSELTSKYTRFSFTNLHAQNHNGGNPLFSSYLILSQVQCIGWNRQKGDQTPLVPRPCAYRIRWWQMQLNKTCTQYKELLGHSYVWKNSCKC